MKKLFLFCFVLSLICPPTVISQENLEECTIGVASGKATADGRPLLWKNRDGSYGPREVVYFKDGRFKHMAVVVAGGSQSVGAGVNEFGFCIVESAAFDLPRESKEGIFAGNIMKLPLQQCVTVDDFENLLKQTNVSGRTTTNNFGVIDAFGGAAIFETGNFSYTRFDANDPKVAPKGYIIRACFTFTGGGDQGRARYDRANQLWQQVIEKNQLDYRYVLRKVCRDLSGAEKVSYTPPKTEVTENNTCEVLNTQNAISRSSTTYVALFHGVRPDENPSLTTFWTIMGEPIFSVAVPSWVIAESTAPEMDGAELSPLCTAARDLHQANYLIGNGRRLLLNPDMLPDIWALTYPAEDRIFDQAESILTQWRQDYPTARQVAWFHRHMASEAMDTLQEVIELLVQKGATNANLRIALYMRDLEKAGAFIKESVNINVLDGHGYAPLHYAVQNNQKKIIELLIAKGADVNVKNSNGLTPIDLAVSQDRKEIVELLLAKGNGINTIHLAAYLGNLQSVKTFIENGTKVDAKDDNGKTPLYTAAEEGQKSIVELLITKGADVNTRNKLSETVLEAACWSGHADIAELLVTKGADVNARDRWGYTPLYYAIGNKDMDKDIARLFLANGADVNFVRENGYPYLHHAVWQEDLDLVRSLVEHGAKFDVKDEDGWTAFRYAAKQGNSNLIEFFVGKGADVSSFHMVACVGDLTRVKSFVEQGTDVDTKDELGWTPLHWAVSTGRRAVAEFLVAKGASIDHKAGEDRTPLHYASIAGQKDMAALLIAKGAGVNSRDVYDQTPLHLSVRQGHKDTVELFISKGADLNAKNKRGQIPLDIAINRGHKEITELLRKHGAKE